MGFREDVKDGFHALRNFASAREPLKPELRDPQKAQSRKITGECRETRARHMTTTDLQEKWNTSTMKATEKYACM
jgi:hypothetical protein